MFNLGKDTYRRYESEEYIIPIKHLNSLCNFYKVSFDYIFGFTKEKNHTNSKESIEKIMIAKRLKQLHKG